MTTDTTQAGLHEPPADYNDTPRDIPTQDFPPNVTPLLILDYEEHFRRRVIQDALNEATAAYWNRRADTLEAARPRRGDYTGQATTDQLTARYDRLTATTTACRAAATLALIQDQP